MKNVQERTARKVKNGHYVATPHSVAHSPPPYSTNRGYSTDGDESNYRAPSERTLSEYTVTNERASPPEAPTRKSRDKSRNNAIYDGPRPLSSPPSRPPPRAPSAMSAMSYGGDNGDIYVTSAVYKAPSEISRYTVHRSQQSRPRSIYSVASSHKTGQSRRSGQSRRMGAKVEAMSAPNPFCPNIKGVCCLMLLINLGLILVTLGFVIVIQFVEPLFVWILGVVFLIFGFITLIGSMIYCVVVCRDFKHPSQIQNEDIYWKNHWQKNIGYNPHTEIDYKTDPDRYSVSKMSGKYSDRESNRY